LDELRALQRPDKPSVLQRVADAYLRETPGLIETLQQALSSQDRNALRVSAHTLKSSSANLGAAELARQCLQLEADAETAAWTELSQLVRTTLASCGPVLEALRKLAVKPESISS
jgi:HPt (histidine-containing phosphotransfer) domain-containing protein